VLLSPTCSLSEGCKYIGRTEDRNLVKFEVEEIVYDGVKCCEGEIVTLVKTKLDNYVLLVQYEFEYILKVFSTAADVAKEIVSHGDLTPVDDDLLNRIGYLETMAEWV